MKKHTKPTIMIRVDRRFAANLKREARKLDLSVVSLTRLAGMWLPSVVLSVMTEHGLSRTESR